MPSSPTAFEPHPKAGFPWRRRRENVALDGVPDPFSDEDKAWLTEFFRETMERIDPEYVSRLEDRSKYAEDTAHEFSFLGFFNYEEATKFAAALVADVAFLDTLIDTSRRGGKVNEHQLATLLALIEPDTGE